MPYPQPAIDGLSGVSARLQLTRRILEAVVLMADAVQEVGAAGLTGDAWNVHGGVKATDYAAALAAGRWARAELVARAWTNIRTPRGGYLSAAQYMARVRRLRLPFPCTRLHATCAAWVAGPCAEVVGGKPGLPRRG